MREYIKLFMLSIVTLFIILLGWITIYDKYCFSLIFPIIILSIISYSQIEIKMQERKCFRKCYFKDKTIISKFLSSKIFVIIISIIISIIMTISISYSLIYFSFNWWIYLIFHTATSSFFYLIIISKSLVFIKEPYNKIFAKEWTGYLMLLILIPSFIYSTLNGYAPIYLDESLEQTIINSSVGILSNCEIINYIFKLMREIDAILWWLILNSTNNIDKTWLKSLIWIAFIIYNSITLLGLNRLILEIIHILKNKKINLFEYHH